MANMGGYKLSEFGDDWKKIRGTFWFCHTESLDFGSIWPTLNHLLQQGKFWLCARISQFFAWFDYI